MDTKLLYGEMGAVRIPDGISSEESDLSDVHFIDMTVVNCWLLARRAEKFDMPLLDTKLAIADALCKAGKPARQTKVGSLQQMYENKRKKGPPKEIPQVDIRKDGLHHYPYWDGTNRSRCKYPDCTGKTYNLHKMHSTVVSQ